MNDERAALFDIYNGTDLRTMIFSRYDNGCFACLAETKLKGLSVTTVWEIQKNLDIRFITLIPGGEKRWK